MRARTLLVCSLCACGAPPVAETTVAPPPVASSIAPRLPTVERSLQNVGLDALAIDRGADPCKDFYQFACGGWLRSNQIPDEEPAWLRSVDGIRTANEVELRRILEAAAGAGATADAETRQLGDFHAACMDEAAVATAGVRPIEPLLAKIRALRDVSDSAPVVAQLHSIGAWPLFRISVRQDTADPTRWITNIDQAGLGLPDRDLYLGDDAETKTLRSTYAAHVASMLRLAGLAPALAKQAAADTLEIETSIAKVSAPAAALQDPRKIDNRIERARLAQLAPRFAWDAYLSAQSLSGIRQLNATSIEFLEGIGRLLPSIRASAWRGYLSWHAVRAVSPALPDAFARETATLDRALMGQTQRPARWRQCIWAAEEMLPHLVARRFVEARFRDGSKRSIDELVASLRAVLAARLGEVRWMDEPTRARAVAKLADMVHLVGHPETYERYDVTLDRRRYADNLMALRRLSLRRTLGKAGERVDRGEWTMAPSAINAAYDPQKNHAVFPAGILQPPLFSEGFGAAVNLGAIGTVIGHELTHAFDTEGAQFDPSGKLADWWAPATRKEFDARAACVQAQYGAQEALPGLKVDGRLTLNENIADMGGVALAFRAYRAMRAGAREAISAEGFDEDQQFFLAVGQTWCGHFRPELERLAAQNDPHAPVRLRVNGPLANMREFARAFSCAEGSAMRPASTCSIW